MGSAHTPATDPPAPVTPHLLASARTPAGAPPAPVTPHRPDSVRVLPITVRLIVRYAKRGRMRFASHRDIARAVERGVRRAGLPVAHSAGFTPHPKISYAGAAPTGTASEAEYLEIGLTETRAASDVRDRLDAALPDGIDVIDVIEGPASLADLRLEASRWLVVLPGVEPEDAGQAVGAFLASGSVEVERLTAKGSRRVDARAAVITMETDRCAADTQATGNAILRMVVRHMTPAVRPDDILAALRQVADLAPSSPALVTRLAQGPLDPEAASAQSGAAMRRRAPGRADEHVETTRLGAGPAGVAGALPAGACDQLLRGAEDPVWPSAPGSLTGDSPDARDRAERYRAQR
jgi:radical SAM-linked protein